MTAVDVDALDKLRDAATADGEWRVLDIDNRPGPHSREILDDEGSVAVCSGDNDATGNTIGADRAALIVAAVNALPDLIAAVRERDALRGAVANLAAELGEHVAHAQQEAHEWEGDPHRVAEWEGKAAAYHWAGALTRAVLAAVAGGGQR